MTAARARYAPSCEAPSCDVPSCGAPSDDLRVGVISDTHGVLRPEARAFLLGSDYIVHGGDIGTPQILDELSSLAPLVAVKGNNDTQPWAQALRETELVRIGNIFVCVTHNLAQLAGTYVSQARVVISGHTHQPAIHEQNSVMFLNPGSCGPRRFKLPISVAELRLRDGQVTARLITLCD